MSDLNQLTETIIGLAIKIHRKLGPGFLESVYQNALAFELEKAGIPFEREKALPVQYEDVRLKIGFRCDFLVDRRLILECKAAKTLTRIDQSQLLNYLKVSNLKIGLIINFNVPKLVSGIKRVVNKFED
jgi:GxxExxY protein